MGTERLNHIILLPSCMTVHFYFLFTANDCAKNIKIQTTKSAPAFRTTFWAISPAWTELLTCKRKLKIFKVQDFLSIIFLKATSVRDWLPGLCQIGVYHSPYTHSKCWTLGSNCLLGCDNIMPKLGCGILHFLSDFSQKGNVTLYNAYQLPCSKISISPHIIRLYSS